MTFTVTTPAILFPATSLILLAYTVKLLHLGGLVRALKNKFQEEQQPDLLKEMENLRQRIFLIRNMQAFGVCCLLFCSICMLCLFADWFLAAKISFSISLLMLLLALAYCFREIQISATALQIALEELGENEKESR
ncbi:DUF2721 domain-containing protein [Desertivirga brevis]|uniref:DUF2721 domain-containing protein n=1 Tax=Desertivirga brevis TaxID=2810310 RepID=UPI001A97870D|nr:DUF2721 domain-containing protein [Pedobacter sp. SYSU D00873]